MPSVSRIDPTGDPYVDGVLGGVKWAVSSFTFSFPMDASLYGPNYGTGEPENNFKALSANQQNAVRSVLQAYSSVANIRFSEVVESSIQSGDLRYAESDSPSTAWGYLPTKSAVGGDVWFNNSTRYYDNPVKGSYAYVGILHETGHALGLKHPQSISGSFGIMPADRDSLEYTVMSYRSYIGAPLTGYTATSASFPQSLMMYDVAALQTMYGANYATNSGDTVYRWSPTTGQEFVNGVARDVSLANKIFMTLWDGGGEDTYDFSNYTTNLSVALDPGAWTIVSVAQLAVLGSGHYAVGNIANSLLSDGNIASLIEDAIGGSGNDVIVGNQDDNKLSGNAGNDVLDGNIGTDIAIYSGLSTDYIWKENPDGTWVISDLRGGSPDGVDTLENIEELRFSDRLVPLNGVAATVNTITAGSSVSTGLSPTSSATSDILWRNDSGAVAIWEMNGISVHDAKIIPGADAVPLAWHIAGTGDFNGDGMSDILWRNDSGAVSIWQMNGMSLQNGKVIPGAEAVPLSWHIAGAGDFNGDDMSDILWRNDSGAVAIWQMNGTSVQNGKVIPGAEAVPLSWHIAGTGDFNGDGMSDVLWRNDSGAVSIWQMNGTSLQNGKVIPGAEAVPLSWHIAGTEDFNGDGMSDILWWNDGGAVAIWEMNGTSAQKALVIPGAEAVPLDWHIAGTGDFNADGKSDILWRNDSGAVSIWEMNGTSVANAAVIPGAESVPQSWHIVDHGLLF